MAETIVISLGGSLIVPDDIDTEFLRKFRSLILEEMQKGKKFLIVTGGGKIGRNYQNTLRQIIEPSDEDLDWIGIHATRLNAVLMKILLEGQAEVLGGESPGSSTDLVAVKQAVKNNAKKIVNLSNTDYVYDSDPKANPNAKKFERISWRDYRNLIPKDWQPGLHTPFDPRASEMAEKEGIEVLIMNGKPLSNLKDYLSGKSFKGTTIS